VAGKGKMVFMLNTFHCPHCLTPLHLYEAGETMVRCPACTKVVMAPKTDGRLTALYAWLPFSTSRFFVEADPKSKLPVANF
jgi:LSD1 subclass zinc finger protein